MSTDYLYEFLILARTLNFSQAAEKLFINQSTLSRHISLLEKELGETLFERNSHNVSLTDKGRLFVQEASRLQLSYDQMINTFEHKNNSYAKHIRIAVSTTSYSFSVLEQLRKTAQTNSHYAVTIDILPDTGIDKYASDYDILLSPFENHMPATMKYSGLFVNEPAYLAVNSFTPITDPVISFSRITDMMLIVPYREELFCSYNYIRQYLERVSGYSFKTINVINAETAMLYVQEKAGVTIVPQHYSNRAFRDVFFMAIDDPNCLFTTFVYVRKEIDTQFMDELKYVLQE